MEEAPRAKSASRTPQALGKGPEDAPHSNMGVTAVTPLSTLFKPEEEEAVTSRGQMERDQLCVSPVTWLDILLPQRRRPWHPCREQLCDGTGQVDTAIG